jgi:hypothetical protein
MEEEFKLLESTFRKAGFQEELTTCILEILSHSCLQANIEKFWFCPYGSCLNLIQI